MKKTKVSFQSRFFEGHVSELILLKALFPKNFLLGQVGHTQHFCSLIKL